jgi:hypothetical protein
MFSVPPPTKTHWVYDDPSGVPEPVASMRRWHPHAPVRAPRVVERRRIRLVHREG